MFVVLVYDVGQKRVQKAMKICKKYLHHIQRSVFEGLLTDAQLMQLQAELIHVLDTECDAVCIYRIGSLKYSSKVQLGVTRADGNIIE